MGLIRYVCTHSWIPLWALKLIYCSYRIYSQWSIKRSVKAIDDLYENVSRETKGDDAGI